MRTVRNVIYCLMNLKVVRCIVVQVYTYVNTANTKMKKVYTFSHIFCFSISAIGALCTFKLKIKTLFCCTYN